MSVSFYKVLWILLHLLADLIEAIYHFGLEFRENFFNFIKIISQSATTADQTDDRLLIERHLHEIKKLPKHLAVILNVKSKKDVDVNQLTNLVQWALSSGANFISFYDYRGIVKCELASSFQKNIEQQVSINESENIVWGPKYQTTDSETIRFPHRNGYKKHIVVNLYSSEDGHVKFNQLLSQELCNKSNGSAICDSKQITIDYIDEKLRKLYGEMPDPDLAVFFGNTCCTMGFMPWQIRLTEFIPISFKLNNLSLEKYLRVLYRYAKCEQRLGK